MNRRAASSLVFTLIFGVAGPRVIGAGAGPDLPAILYHEAYEQPVWVSQSALDADPALLSAVLPPGTVELIADWANVDECIEMRVLDEPATSEGGAGILSEDIRRAEKILLGKIAGRETGIFQGRPGTLYRIEPIETFFGRARGGDELVFVPIGEVRVADRRLCGTDDGFPVVPTVGQEILLVVPRHWFNAGDILFVGGNRGFLPIVDDEVREPSAKEGGADRPRSKDDFIRWIHELRAGRGGS